MGWEHILSGLIAGWIVDRREKKKTASQYTSYSGSASPVGAAVTEQQFIRVRNKTIIARYQTVSTSWFDDSDDEHELLPLYLLASEDIEKLRYYYARVEINPTSINSRTALIHFLYKLAMHERQICFIPLLQNELLYIIDYYEPKTQQEEMYQHLALFISSECYFFTGNFALALKRLYQTLDWQAIYDNVSEKDGIDFNGLSSFHEAVIVNIINIYALAGLADRAATARTAFARVVKEYRQHFSSMMSDYRHNDSLYQFAYDSAEALMASEQIRGYYTLSLSSYNENLFKESCTAIIRGQPTYSIECEFQSTKDISFEKAWLFYDNVFQDYPIMVIRYKGSITNYIACLDRDREEIREI